MAKFDNFSDDEHVMLSHIISVNALINKVAELTGLSTENIRFDVARYAGEYVASMSERDAKKLLKDHVLFAAN